MALNEKLTGADYMSQPMLQLQSHPDFSMHAFRVMVAISKMTTEQIQNIDVVGVNGGSRSRTN